LKVLSRRLIRLIQRLINLAESPSGRTK